MTKLVAKPASGAEGKTIRINNGKVQVEGEKELSDLAEPFADMQIMVGQRPPKEDDTPAEELKPATDSEIKRRLIGVLRENGYGVKTP